MDSEVWQDGCFLDGGYNISSNKSSIQHYALSAGLPNMICAICSGTIGTQHMFREMMFGTRDEFPYWECSACGCLQIGRIPQRMGDYYPDDYYSFSLHLKPLELWLYRAYFKANRLAQRVHRIRTLQSVIDAKPKHRARILDVGCGAGKLVTVLRRVGFDAHGADPFAKRQTPYVRRAALEEAENSWDLIMFHHSLEHMADNVAVLRSARQKLARHGTCLVRIPVAAWAWQHYGKNWVQLDAPRHLVIHTLESFSRASELAGFRICQIVFDSTAFQFYGSELYKCDIPQKHGDSEKARFARAVMREFSAHAAELNRQQLGDQACFYLKATTT